MKNLFFAAMAALVCLCSCSKEYDEIVKSQEGGIVNVSFVEEVPKTRAFFGSTAAAEAWEKTLNNITLFVFNSSTGNIIIQRTFSASEVSAKKATFALPGVVSGQSCDFYAVANASNVGNVSNKTALLAALDKDIALYNGTFAEVTNTAKRPGGFIMSGSTTKAIAAAGASTDVAITLKRTVAKIAIEITPSATFSSLYPGTIRVNSVTIKKAASQTPIINPAAISTGIMNYTYTQPSDVASNKYRNLFYCYENGPLAAGSRVTLTVNATYDVDKNFSTTTDQTPISYDVELVGNSNNGTIARNGYYKVSISLTGLAGSTATMLIVAADWETPSTQTINVGI